MRELKLFSSTRRKPDLLLYLMRITILAIGRVRNDPIKQVYDDYISRLPWPCELKELQNPTAPTNEQQREKEAKLLINALPQKSFSIALDKQGQMLSSEAFAKKISSLRDHGMQGITFLIGGPEGHGEAVFKNTDFIFSLGPMVWPHLLVRAMLAEQLWRAASILSNHPYHRT